ncbi:protein translocase subunit SecD [Aliarcobacter skirrowii]|uniref:protein translocase subunit SecD n=1 Tax=Aliarcobacter skirrowii TaxID=28200 RepID=UPI0029A3A39A|nr:protein translocase subunit SecD [Aliarcobacter skirrowii]MDX3959806.1 protein translocase subunit SecD [Aliarcobacter skirrowii]MDX4037475.1 protein translocase subunit SecD [Aliarcobacter skirrowii]
MKFLNFKLTIFLVAFIFGIVFSFPSLFQTESGKKVNLGLDLQGGLHMLLGVNTHEAVTSKMRSIATAIKHFTDDEEVLIDGLTVINDNIIFSLLDKDDVAKMDKMLEEIKGLSITKDNLEYKIELTRDEIIKTKDYSVAQAVETIRNRLDQFGLSEPTVLRQGESDIIVQLPGIKTVEQEKDARELISKPANLELMAIDENRADQVYKMTNKEASLYGDIILEDTKNPNIKYLVKEIPILDGNQIVDAQVAFNQSNQPIINFTLNSSGARIFADFTAKNVGKRLAIVLDGKVYSAPNINERIGGGSGQISGGFTVQEAGNVAIALRSGALLASINMLEKRSVGPSLGADSIKASMIALISGTVLIFLFMMLYYRRAGMIANIALIANIFILLAVIALFGATLTLPGMAGIILTMGMAIDSNVIINERIREALRAGASVQKAIEDGYSNALRAIIDANVTTLLVAIVLYAYGSGAIKGFAVTISIGILTSMLTSIVGTHGIYKALLPKISKDKNNKKWFGVA